MVRAVASHQCDPGLIPGLTQHHMWVEFAVDSRPCSERFFSGYSGFCPLLKSQHFQIPIRSGLTLNHEPMARGIVRGLLVLLTVDKFRAVIKRRGPGIYPGY